MCDFYSFYYRKDKWFFFNGQEKIKKTYFPNKL